MRRVRDIDKLLEDPQNHDWTWISMNCILTKDQIDKAKDYLDWYWITIHNAFSEEEVRKFIDYIKWDWVTLDFNISQRFLRQIKDYISQWKLLDNLYFTKDFRREITNENYSTLEPKNVGMVNRQIYRMDEEQLSEFVSKKDWDIISEKVWMSTYVVRRFQNHLNWFLLSKERNFPFYFYWQMRYKFDWDALTVDQAPKWKEWAFIRFAHYLNWDIIKTWDRKWSDKFKARFAKRLGLLSKEV